MQLFEEEGNKEAFLEKRRYNLSLGRRRGEMAIPYSKHLVMIWKGVKPCFPLSGLGVWDIEWLDGQVRQKPGICAHS